jgi:hypothetical protein
MRRYVRTNGIASLLTFSTGSKIPSSNGSDIIFWNSVILYIDLALFLVEGNIIPLYILCDFFELD